MLHAEEGGWGDYEEGTSLPPLVNFAVNPYLGDHPESFGGDVVVEDQTDQEAIVGEGPHEGVDAADQIDVEVPSALEQHGEGSQKIAE